MELSKRQTRKIARGNTPSRPVRRAALRLAVATAGFDGACKASGKGGAAAYNKPGAQKHW
jgi:hypothetical protein